MLDRVKSAVMRGLALGFNIDLTCRIFAGEENCETGRKSLRGERAGRFRHMGKRPRRDALAIDQYGFFV
jgi:hypothetical protein